MNLEKLKNLLKDEPAFRFKQIYKAVYGGFAESWDEITSVPKDLRAKFEKEIPLKIEHKMFKSSDGTTWKALIIFDDGSKIEAVLMRHKEGRNTVCVSTQVGCPMGCDFCATGKLGLKRNLTADEMTDQVLVFSRILKKENGRVSNVVFMGMGEPMLNFDNVMSAIKILNDKDGFNIGARKISISTCGLIEGIKKLAESPLQVNLAISLHAPNNALRSRIMPVNKTFNIDKLFETLRDYTKKTRNKVMIEYVLLKGVNDSAKDAKELADLLKKELGKLFMVNMISYNATGTYVSPDPRGIKVFRGVLEQEGIEVTQRYRLGHDIDGACGQLAAKNA
ncbi:MAG: 23S rRNA (adenine(2503)-C(2))-methyltransferase RlmN [Candidatus Gracilibacteria bacterium]|jgi:23S rRNA (adenine2503-C2)-methyltransferase